jgi:hypothetical protein
MLPMSKHNYSKGTKTVFTNQRKQTNKTNRLRPITDPLDVSPEFKNPVLETNPKSPPSNPVVGMIIIVDGSSRVVVVATTEVVSISFGGSSRSRSGLTENSGKSVELTVSVELKKSFVVSRVSLSVLLDRTDGAITPL